MNEMIDAHSVDDPAPAPRRKRGKLKKGDDRALSRDLLLDAAVALIDEVGLAGFSVRNLAARMNVFPAAIYWWLPTRNDILAAIVSHALRDIVPPDETVEWKAWIRELMIRYRAVVRQHPHVAPLITSQLVSNAGVDLTLVETLLRVLTRAGFMGEKLLAAYDVVIAAKIGFVSMEFAMPPEDDEAWAKHMQQQIQDLDPITFPLIAEHRTAMLNRHFILRWQNGAVSPLDASFDAHVYTTIAGLRMLLSR